MEAGEGYAFAGIDNKARNAALHIVRAAETSDELLTACHAHFDESVVSLTADSILARLPNETLNERLRATEGFDPTLFRAVVLFELSHLSDDESVLPRRLAKLARFWETAWDNSPEDLERFITAPTKRTHYRPFAVLSQHVKMSIIIDAMDEHREARPPEEPTAPSDPLKDSIDGKKYRVFLGTEELKLIEEDDAKVLTPQLERDLRKLFPKAVVSELSYLFPDDGTFEQLYPFIEKIQYDRANRIMPSTEDLVRAYARSIENVSKWFRNFEEPECDEETEARRATEYFIERHRALESRIHTRDIYVQPLGAWFTIHLLESDTERNVYYRRVFYGDSEAPEQVEVPLAHRQPVIDELDRNKNEADIPEEQRPEPATYHDIFGTDFEAIG